MDSNILCCHPTLCPVQQFLDNSPYIAVVYNPCRYIRIDPFTIQIHVNNSASPRLGIVRARIRLFSQATFLVLSKYSPFTAEILLKMLNTEGLSEYGASKG